jgi:predicted DNA-binding transcriptional regulator AlpA
VSVPVKIGGIGILEQPLLNRRLAATYLGVSVSTLHRWAATQQGPRYLKIGRQVRYTEHDLRSFVANSVAE